MVQSTVIYRDNRGTRRVQKYSGGVKTSSYKYNKKTWNKNTGGKSSSQYLTDEYVKQELNKQKEIKAKETIIKPRAEDTPTVTKRIDNKEYYYTELSAEGKVSRNIGVDVGGTGRNRYVETSTEINNPTARRVEAGKKSISPNFEEDATPEMINISKRQFKDNKNTKAIFFDTPEGDRLRITRDDVISPPNKFKGVAISKADKKVKDKPLISLKEGFVQGFNFRSQKDSSGRDLLTREKSYQSGYIGGSVGGLFLTGGGGGLSAGKGFANVAYKYPKIAKGVQSVGTFMSKTKTGKTLSYGLGAVYTGSKGYQGYKEYKKDGSIGVARVGLQTTRDVSTIVGFTKGYNTQLKSNIKQNYQLFKPKTTSSTKVTNKKDLTVVSKSRGKLYEFTKDGKLWDTKNVYDKSVFKGTRKQLLTESGQPTNNYRYDGIIKSDTRTYKPVKVKRKTILKYGVKKQIVYKKSTAIKSESDVNILAGEKSRELFSVNTRGGRVSGGIGKTNYFIRGQTNKGERLTGTGKIKSQYQGVNNNLGSEVKSQGTTSTIYSTNKQKNDLIIKGEFRNAIFNIDKSTVSTSSGSSNLQLQQKGIQMSIAKNLLKSKTTTTKINPVIATTTPTNKQRPANKNTPYNSNKNVARSLFKSKTKTKTQIKTETNIKINSKQPQKIKLILGTKAKNKKSTYQAIGQPKTIISNKISFKPVTILNDSVAQNSGQRIRPKQIQKTSQNTIYPTSFITTTTGGGYKPPTNIIKIIGGGFNKPDFPKPQRKKFKNKNFMIKIKDTTGYSPSLEASVLNIKKSKDEDLFRSGLTIRPIRRYKNGF